MRQSPLVMRPVFVSPYRVYLHLQLTLLTFPRKVEGTPWPRSPDEALSAQDNWRSVPVP